MIIPTNSTLQFNVKFMVYDSKNTRIYEDTDEIKGSLWGNIGTLYYGFRPFNDFDQNGASFLIKELLFRFQASEELNYFKSSSILLI